MKYKNLNEYILEFTNILISNFSKDDLINFYNNIVALNNFSDNFKFNKIYINKVKFTNKVFHELFHISSSTFINGRIYSGFQQCYYKPQKTIIGTAINDGYTELLVRRYFGKVLENYKSHEYEVYVAQNLEKIIGKEVMENLYLTSNFHGLIHELNRFSCSSESIKFINDTDFIFENLYNKNINLSEKQMLLESLKNIRLFLIKTYSKKILYQYISKDITFDSLERLLIEFISSLPVKIKVSSNIYDFHNNEEVKHIIKDIYDIANNNLKKLTK